MRVIIPPNHGAAAADSPCRRTMAAAPAEGRKHDETRRAGACASPWYKMYPSEPEMVWMVSMLLQLSAHL
jgi:hypothetical protein